MDEKQLRYLLQKYRNERRKTLLVLFMYYFVIFILLFSLFFFPFLWVSTLICISFSFFFDPIKKKRRALFLLSCCIRIHEIELGDSRKKAIDPKIYKIFQPN
jgi:hypothetical protein